MDFPSNETMLNSTVDYSFGGHTIQRDHACMILLEDIKIFPQNFQSKDWGTTREGFFTVAFGEQQTTYPFKGKPSDVGLNIEPKYMDKLLYFGTVKTHLPIRIQLIESDKKARKIFSKISSICSNSDKLDRGGMLSAISSGFGFLGAISGIVGDKIKDDEEAHFLGSYPNPKDKEKITYTLKNQNKVIVQISVLVKDLGQINKERPNFRIAISDPKFTWDAPEISAVDASLGNEEIDHVETTYQPYEYIEKVKRLKNFNLEATYKNDSKALSLYLPGLINRLTWNEYELFETKGLSHSAESYNIPLSLGFSLNREEVNAENWIALTTSPLPLLSSLGIDTTDIEEKIEKQGQSLFNKINELSGSEISLYSFDGALILPPTTTTEDVATGKGELILNKVQNDRWEKEVEKDIVGTAEGKRTRFGSFSFKLFVELI